MDSEGLLGKAGCGRQLTTMSLAISFGLEECLMCSAVMRLTRQMAAARNSAKAGVLGGDGVVRPRARAARWGARWWFPCLGDEMILRGGRGTVGWAEGAEGTSDGWKLLEVAEGPRGLLREAGPHYPVSSPGTPGRTEGRASGALGMRPAPQALLTSGLVCFIIIVLILKLFLDTANWIYGFIGLPVSPQSCGTLKPVGKP